jgi:hypothetical protein
MVARLPTRMAKKQPKNTPIAKFHEIFFAQRKVGFSERHNSDSARRPRRCVTDVHCGLGTASLAVPRFSLRNNPPPGAKAIGLEKDGGT